MKVEKLQLLTQISLYLNVNDTLLFTVF